jgi:hypothetical protein
MKNYLFIALTIGLSFMTFMAFQKAKPTTKAPIYKEIQKFSPYYLDKRFGGLQIMSREDETFKEKPNSMEIFHRLEFLEKEWGKNHLKLLNDQLIIEDNNHATLIKLPLKSDENRQFIHSFYGI